MRYFVTGATGNIGARTVRELIAAGHEVIGLSRSREKAVALAADGAEVVIGSIDDDAVLTEGAARSDGVIHLAFNHDFTRFRQNCEDDRRVIRALAAGLSGTRKPLVVTSGTPMANTIPGEPAREGNPILSSAHHPRAATEEEAVAVAAEGINASVVRLPQVHDPVSQGLFSPIIGIYRARGACSYVGEGEGRWPSAHVVDVARLYRLAVERAEPGARYHAVAEEGIPMRLVVETVARRLGLPAQSIAPDEAGEVFGWLAMFAGADMPASSEETRRVTGWNPTGPTLLADLERLYLAEG